MYSLGKHILIKRLIKGVVMGLSRIRRIRRPLAVPPSVERYNYLFIGGLHRSATSILHRLLREHSATSGFADTGVPENEGQHLQSVFPPGYKHGGPGSFVFDLRSHLTEHSSLVTDSNRDRLLCQWGAYHELDKKVLLEKSPGNLVRARFFQALFPHSSFVFMVRHPLAVALATQKWTRRSLLELLLHWHVAYSILLQDLSFLRRYRLVRYEDFVASPQPCLDDICGMLAIDNFVPRETVVNHNGKYFSLWEREYRNDSRLIEKVFPVQQGPMAQFGYTLTEPYVTGMDHGLLPSPATGTTHNEEDHKRII